MHNIESMFSVREKPWHYDETKDATKIIQSAPTSADALRYAGLDWVVEPKPIFDANGVEIPNFKANTRSSDGSVLGVVTDRYKIVQNAEAFDFTDSLIGGDVRYETAGSLRGGKTIWLLAKLGETEILGDKFEPYVCFSNSHDGSGAIKVCCTPIRVVCNNTLNLALAGAKRSWSTRHMGDISSKLREAQHTLELSHDYIDELGKDIERLANKPISMDEINAILAALFPIDENDSNIKKERAQAAKDNIMMCYYAPDIQQFMGTAYGFINAVSDFVGHAAPNRNSATYRANNWGKIMDGHVMLDTVYDMVKV